jgi:hypothetical protein
MLPVQCLKKLEEKGVTKLSTGDANVAYKMVTSFEFILILHLMKGIMGITNVLCQAVTLHLLQKDVSENFDFHVTLRHHQSYKLVAEYIYIF